MVMSGPGHEQFLTAHLWPALTVSNAQAVQDCRSCFLGGRSHPVERVKQAVMAQQVLRANLLHTHASCKNVIVSWTTVLSACVMSPFPSRRPALPTGREKHKAEVEDVKQQVRKWGNQPPPRSKEAQRVFKNQLVERYQAAVPGRKLRCMITGAEIPWSQCRAGHILSLATFEEASRRGLLKFADSYDVRNGILWAGTAQGTLASYTCISHQLLTSFI